MQSFLLEHYLWIKALHIISVMAWMAGMLYLPRLFVYHAQAVAGSELSETLKIMERRLLRFIINPAMIAAFLFGGLMFWGNPDLLQAPWMHIKLTAIVLMTGVHGLYARWRKTFERDENTRNPRFYRIWNEIPTILMIVIVLMAVAKPF
ncbi:MAG: protoporphyrinogen oxidase HemJ [Rhodospirillales bacterium]|nr:protoporphyrinogen oxidase HemJ [Alphaproteobacteria bacterium]USO04116.1 MAG: protoporphyrinogen oxidase HemJ [Rhodospirillales bacterium]